MKEIFIYIDESMSPHIKTESINHVDDRYFFLGMLVTDTPAAKEIIDSAMLNLSNEVEEKSTLESRLDDATIARGFFHACQDSKNAHSYICEEINKLDIGWQFHVLFWDKEKTGAEDLNSERQVHKHAIHMLLLEFDSLIDTLLHVQIANRTSFGKAQIKEIFQDINEGIIYTASKQPWLVFVLNEVKIKTVDATEPGTQICDFMLWAYQRMYISNDNTWFSRIKDYGRIRMKTKPADGYPFGSDYISGKVDFEIPYIQSEELYGKWISCDECSKDAVNNSLIWVEDFIKNKHNKSNGDKDKECQKIILCNIMRYLSFDIEKEYKKGLEVIDELSKCVLLILDTLVLESTLSESEKIHAQIAKRFAAKVADTTENSWMRCRSYWNEIRLKNKLFKAVGI